MDVQGTVSWKITPDKKLVVPNFQDKTRYIFRFQIRILHEKYTQEVSSAAKKFENSHRYVKKREILKNG